MPEGVIFKKIKDSVTENEEILKAFNQIDRKEFLPQEQKPNSDQDRPLPIGNGQTISQPSLVAQMTAKLNLDDEDKVLEIGTGSGYQAAILSKIADKVYTIERFKDLADRAEKILDKIGCKNVEIKVDDGTKGWPEYAPYDGIIVTAAAPDIPPPLVEQLAKGGRIVIPVGGKFSQKLKVCEKKDGELETLEETYVRFVPLVGEYGWDE
ncbi:MAG: protein-L-isoaspartate(D-aspartate) O-methyltransferase [Candidatus Magasanikbacteria bacterium]